MSKRITWSDPICPFCKGRLGVGFSIGLDPCDPNPEYAVQCLSCNLTGPRATTKKKAINKWKYRYRADGKKRIRKGK